VWVLLMQYWTDRALATALGVPPGAVSQWLRRAHPGGSEHCGTAHTLARADG